MPSMQEELLAKLRLSEENNSQELKPSDLQIVENLRQTYGDILKYIKNVDLLSTFKLWSQSEDKNDPQTFLGWFSKVPEVAPIEVEPIENIIIEVEEEIPSSLELEVGEQIVSKDEIKIVSNDLAEELQDEPDSLDDLTYRQRLSFMVDEVARRRDEEIKAEIINTVMSVYKQKFTDSSDIHRQLAETARLRDFLVQLLHNLDIKVNLTVVPFNNVEVGSALLSFSKKGEYYRLIDFENGLRQALSVISNYKSNAQLITQLQANNSMLQTNIVKLNKELSAATLIMAQQDEEYKKLKAEKKPIPFLDNGKPLIVIRWSVTIEEKTTEYYLSVEDGVNPNAKGVFPTASLRRSKFLNDALRFDSETEALIQLKKMMRNKHKLAKGCKITERAIKSAQIINMHAMITPFTTQ